MSLLPKWAPNVHPALVHFPIAILIVALFFDILSIFFRDKHWLTRSAVFLYVLGTISAIITFYTGREAAEGLKIPLDAQMAVGTHMRWAFYTVWFYGLVTLARLGTLRNKWYLSGAVKSGAIVLGLIGVFLLYETGDHGARLVYKYGLGTQPVIRKMNTHQVQSNLLSAGTPVMDTNGGWSWIPSAQAPQVLSADFKWILGTPNDLNPVLKTGYEGEKKLILHPDGKKDMFVFDQPYKYVQIKAIVTLKSFQGKIAVVDHVEDARNYDFLSYNNGTVIQGRYTNGKRKIYERREIGDKKDINFTFDVAGEHHHGHINGKEVTHTHINLRDPAPAGLMIDGKGVLSLKYLGVKVIPPDHDND